MAEDQTVHSHSQHGDTRFFLDWDAKTQSVVLFASKNQVLLVCLQYTQLLFLLHNPKVPTKSKKKKASQLFFSPLRTKSCVSAMHSCSFYFTTPKFQKKKTKTKEKRSSSYGDGAAEQDQNDGRLHGDSSTRSDLNGRRSGVFMRPAGDAGCFFHRRRSFVSFLFGPQHERGISDRRARRLWADVASSSGPFWSFLFLIFVRIERLLYRFLSTVNTVDAFSIVDFAENSFFSRWIRLARQNKNDQIP